MSLEIDFKEKEGYFHATVTGPFSNEGALPLFEKLLLYAAVTRLSKVLVDCRGMEADMYMAEILAFSTKTTEIMSDYSNAGRIKEMRSAYLFHEDLHDPDQIGQNVNPDSNDDFIITTNYNDAIKFLQAVESVISIER